MLILAACRVEELPVAPDGTDTQFQLDGAWTASFADSVTVEMTIDGIGGTAVRDIPRVGRSFVGLRVSSTSDSLFVEYHDTGMFSGAPVHADTLRGELEWLDFAGEWQYDGPADFVRDN